MSFPLEQASGAAEGSRKGTAAEEAVWQRIREEAEIQLEDAPDLAPHYASVLAADSFGEALAGWLAAKLSSSALTAEFLKQMLFDAVRGDRSIGGAACADIVAIVERDPATARLIDAFLFSKI